MKRSWIATVMLVLIMASLAACGEPAVPATESVAGPEQPVITAETTTSPPEDTLPPYGGPVQLTAWPANPEHVAHIYPNGGMIGAHVTPIDHQYYYWKDPDAALEAYPVFSPAGGYVIDIQYLQDDYIVFIEHSTSVQTAFIHLERLAGPLAYLDGTITFNQSARVRIPVEAGELIAWDGGTNGFDFSVHDYSVTLPGFVNPSSYDVEPWKVHTMDPYDYFTGEMRDALLPLNVRQVPPLGGKIDHDIPGRLIGNWFVENTNGYAGIRTQSGPIAPDQQTGYWNTHLAIAPDPIDPNAMIASFGSWEGATAQLLITDPVPHPRDVSPESGIIAYELSDWDYVYGDNRSWRGTFPQVYQPDIRVIPGYGIRGTVLFQLIDDGRLKMEAFPGRSADTVNSFTDSAIIYTR